jgi:hypothetical protein
MLRSSEGYALFSSLRPLGLKYSPQHIIFFRLSVCVLSIICETKFHTHNHIEAGTIELQFRVIRLLTFVSLVLQVRGCSSV